MEKVPVALGLEYFEMAPASVEVVFVIVLSPSLPAVSCHSVKFWNYAFPKSFRDQSTRQFLRSSSYHDTYDGLREPPCL